MIAPLLTNVLGQTPIFCGLTRKVAGRQIVLRLKRRLQLFNETSNRYKFRYGEPR